MKAISINGRIILGVPKFWVMQDGTHDHAFDTRPDAIHYADGWKDVVEPQILTNQRKGQIIEGTTNFTYEVIPFTPEEIAAVEQQAIDAKLALAEEERQEKLKKEIEASTLAPFQALTDVNALEKQTIYPIWEKLETGYQFSVGNKYQALQGDELKLYKTIQAHQKQDDWHPTKVPALFSEIKMSAGVEVWTQPTGGDGKYVFEAIVSHKGSNWQNTHAAPSLNVWEPGVFGWVKV